VRQAAGLKPADPGPLPAGSAKEQLRSKISLVLEGGLYDLQQALVIDPQYDDAMAYMNLLIRERADLRDNAADYQRDIAEASAWVDKAIAAKKAGSGSIQIDPLPEGQSPASCRHGIHRAPAAARPGRQRRRRSRARRAHTRFRRGDGQHGGAS
jgi:hypothetical protein